MSDDELKSISLAEISAARDRLKPHIRQTPVFKLDKTGLDQFAIHSNIYLKLENMQLTGSFKLRGALNSILVNSKANTFVCASAGNHGAGLAYAAMILKKKAIVFLPKGTSTTKLNRLKMYNATIVLEGNNWNESHLAATQFAQENNMIYIHPFADEQVICGQGTIGLELQEQIENLDCVVLAVGGGGLLAGVATAIKQINPLIKVIAVEPNRAATITRSIQFAYPVYLNEVNTIAGSLKVSQTDNLNLSIINSLVDQFVLVEDEQIKEATKWLWDNCSLAVEYSAALAMSAILSNRITDQKGQNIVVLICGTGLDCFSD